MWQKESVLTFPDCKSFLDAISVLPQIDQCRIIAMVMRNSNYQQLILDPDMQRWVLANGHVIAAHYYKRKEQT